MRKMIFQLVRKQNNYQRSNAIFSIDFTPSKQAQNLTKKLLTYSNHKKRQLLSEKLLNILSCDANISPVKLKISSTRQWHKKINGRVIFKQYGYYRPKSAYIYIQNLTAVKGQAIAAKTFVNTLLHEWLHHYDTEKLKIYSIHTKGFYLRLRSLKNCLDWKSPKIKS